MKWLFLLAGLGLALLVGAAAGVLIQKNIGAGNLARRVGIPYPTQTPPGPPAPGFEIPAEHKGQMALFILAGQSNMTGWAPLPEQQEIDPMIYVFGNDYRWRLAVEPVDDAANQVDAVSADRLAGFGPSLAFASALRAHHPEMVVGLIPCARSATAIVDWQRNLSDQSLYGSCLKRARAASPMGRIAGVLFFQGENDAADGDRYPQFNPNPGQWSVLFAAFVNDLREDLQAPALPVVFAQIGADAGSPDIPHWELVKEQQRSTRLPMTTMITTDDLPLMDGLHFTTASYRIIGERFAAAYVALLEGQ